MMKILTTIAFGLFSYSAHSGLIPSGLGYSWENSLTFREKEPHPEISIGGINGDIGELPSKIWKKGGSNVRKINISATSIRDFTDLTGDKSSRKWDDLLREIMSYDKISTQGLKDYSHRIRLPLIYLGLPKTSGAEKDYFYFRFSGEQGYDVPNKAGEYYMLRYGDKKPDLKQAPIISFGDFVCLISENPDVENWSVSLCSEELGGYSFMNTSGSKFAAIMPDPERFDLHVSGKAKPGSYVTKFSGIVIWR